MMATISTLIPAYRPTYLTDLMICLSRQTFKDFTVLLSDDSPDHSVSASMDSPAMRKLCGGLDIRVIQGPRLGSLKNIQSLLGQADDQAPLIHILLDDDLIYPEFYRSHVSARGGQGCEVSVSRRWMTTSNGLPCQSLPMPGFVTNSSQRLIKVERPQLFNSTVALCQNWMGEFSNMVLAAPAATGLFDHRLGGMDFYGLSDVGVVLEAGRQGSVGVIQDHLGGFRSHPGQSSASGAQSYGLRCGHLAWLALALGSWRTGCISLEQALASMTIFGQRCAAMYGGDDPQMSLVADLLRRHGSDLSALHEQFGQYWHDLLAEHADSRPLARDGPGLTGRASDLAPSRAASRHASDTAPTAAVRFGVSGVSDAAATLMP